MEKWKRSDSSDSDSVTLTTPIFDFRLIINALTTQYDSDSDSVASENQPLWFPINGPALCCQHFLCFILHNQSIQMTVVYVSKACGELTLG